MRNIAYYVLTYALYTAIAGSFDVAFTLRITGSFTNLTVLYLFYYTCLAIAFAGSTLMVSNGRFSRGFRYALASQAAIGFLMYFLMPTQEHPWILVPYFMLKGVAEGFFWSNRHAAMTCLTANTQRDRFLLSLQAGTVFISVVIPVFAGLFIHSRAVRTGYSGIYAAAATIALIAMLAGPRIREKAPTRPDIRKFPAFLRSPKTGPWRAQIFFGSINGSLSLFAAGVLNVGVLKTEFNIGIYTSAAALLSAVFILFVRRRVTGRSTRRLRWVALGASGDFAGRLVYAVFQSVPSLFFKALCDSFLSPLRAIFAENIIRSHSEDLARSAGYSPLEPYLFQELFILVARIIAFSFCALFFTLIPVGTYAAARAILFVLAFFPILDIFLVGRLEKLKLAQNDIS